MTTVAIVGFPEKMSTHWEYQNSKEPLDILPLIPRMDKTHIVLSGQIKQECNYGLIGMYDKNGNGQRSKKKRRM